MKRTITRLSETTIQVAEETTTTKRKRVRKKDLIRERSVLLNEIDQLDVFLAELDKPFTPSEEA